MDRTSTIIGPGAQICASAVISVNVNFGALALCSFQCTVAHESVVGKASVIYPGTSVSGGTAARTTMVCVNHEF